MPKRIVVVLVGGRIIRSDEVVIGQLPGAKQPSDTDWIVSAREEHWFDRFEPPAEAIVRVREP